MSKIVVVTKYPRLAEYLKKRGIVPQDAAMLPRANTEDVKGAHVYGVVPLWLASLRGSGYRICVDGPPRS